MCGQVFPAAQELLRQYQAYADCLGNHVMVCQALASRGTADGPDRTSPGSSNDYTTSRLRHHREGIAEHLPR
jgi:hypothetical protein